MNRLRLMVLGLGVFLLSAPAWSDQVPGNDPRIIIGNGSGSLPVGSTFLFGSPTGSSPATSPCVVNGIPEADCVFQNATNSTFTSLTFDIDTTLPPGSVLDCGIAIGGPFNNCSIGADADGYLATFTGGPGVLAAGDFSVTVDGWNPGTDFGVGANGNIPPDPGTPEPGTVGLFLTGISGLAITLRRKLRRSF